MKLCKVLLTTVLSVGFFAHVVPSASVAAETNGAFSNWLRGACNNEAAADLDQDGQFSVQDVQMSIQNPLGRFCKTDADCGGSPYQCRDSRCVGV